MSQDAKATFHRDDTPGPTFDSQAPRVDLVATRLGAAELGGVLEGAKFLGFSSQDIDAEAWTSPAPVS